MRILVALCLILGYAIGSNLILNQDQVAKTEAGIAAFKDCSGHLDQQQRQDQFWRNTGYQLGWLGIGLIILCMFLDNIKRLFKPASIAALLLLSTGCRKPFEPVQLEVIKSNEEAFLIPLTGDGKKQASADNEEYLKANLVYTKQVQIPQQWVPLAHETWGWNGKWMPAATLIKVDKSPVTREWTADSASGTSTRNEAIWVMTSDQVEFSTGWTITARIENRDDAVKFLHNYPNGSLRDVLDTEVRSKLQAEFGLEVTDLPMDKLRRAATPHILKTVKSLTEFFKNRGVTITNLGITGGFVYKDKTILETMVKVFNAEQLKTLAVAETNAQLEQNKKVILKATGEADAIMKTRKAEADGIKMISDARMYELEKSSERLPAYVQMKQLELQRELLSRWNGAYPTYFLGSGSNPNMLLQLPTLEGKK